MNFDKFLAIEKTETATEIKITTTYNLHNAMMPAEQASHAAWDWIPILLSNTFCIQQNKSQ